MEKEKYLIKSIEEAYQKLKDGEILIAIINNQTTFFKRQKDSILVNDKQKLLKLSVDNFFEIFKNEVFTIYQEDEGQIDVLKDVQYYNWKHKWGINMA